MLHFLFLFCLAVVPRYGPVDFVILLAFIILAQDAIGKKKLFLDHNLLKVTFCLFLVFPLAIIGFVQYLDPFGIIRLIKLLLLLILVPNAISKINPDFFFKWFTCFLWLSVFILYVEYFDILGLRSMVHEIHGFIHSGREVSYRAKGLFAGYSAAGVTCGFISLFALYCLIRRKIGKVIGVTLFIFAYLATFFTGRTGILISSLGILVFIFYFYRKAFQPKVIFQSVSISSLFVLPLFYLFPFLDMDNIQITFIRTFEVFLNFQETGYFFSESTTEIAKTLQLPNKITEIIHGNGLQHWSSQAMQALAHSSDSGLIQTAYIYGFFAFILYYLPIIYLWVASTNFLSSSWNSTYMMIMVPLAFISEIKGHYIYSTLIFVLISFPYSFKKISNKF